MSEIKFTIKDWNTGIADNPRIGFGKMVGVDTSSYQGCVKPNGRSLSKSTALIPYWFLNNTSRYFAIGDNGTNGKLYTATSSDISTWSECSGYASTIFYGANLWKGYAFGFHSVTTDVGAASSTSFSDFTAMALPTSTTVHPSLSSIDGNLYVGSGSKISQLAEVAGQTFNPATSGTYTYTATILQLPINATVRALEDLGRYLMCMTDRGIYPWSRISGTSYNIPLVPDMTIYVGKNIENKLYFYGKDKTASAPAFYVTDGVNVQKLKDIPLYLFNYQTLGINPLIPTQEAIDYQDGNLLIMTGIGVIGYNIKDGTLFIDNLTSIGEPGNGYTLSGGIKAITSVQYLLGVKNGTTNNLELVDTGTGGATYGVSYVESNLIKFGNKLNTASIDVEAVLYKPLTATGGFKIQYRKTLNDNWSDLKTIDYTTYPSVSSINCGGITQVENIQFRVSFDNANTTATNAPIIKEINIYG